MYLVLSNRETKYEKEQKQVIVDVSETKQSNGYFYDMSKLDSGQIKSRTNFNRHGTLFVYVLAYKIYRAEGDGGPN